MSMVLFLEWAAVEGLELQPDQIDQFEEFESRLYEANHVTNLTRVSREECWVRHFVDSILFHDSFALHCSILDIGTGPGFPAWPLACIRPDLFVTALDSNAKMLNFLRANPLPNLRVVEARAEDFIVREEFDYVTGRAVAPLAAQLEISVGPCRIDGFVVPLRTPNDDLLAPDLKRLGLELIQVLSKTLPSLGAPRTLPIYRKQARTSDKIPRKWAEIKSQPLLKQAYSARPIPRNARAKSPFGPRD